MRKQCKKVHASCESRSLGYLLGMRAWGEVCEVDSRASGREIVRLLRARGFHAQTLWSIAQEAWHVCVTPAETAAFARAVLDSLGA